MDKVIERLEQPFDGTAEELEKLILNYILDHAPRTPTPIGQSPYLELTPALNDPGLFFVERSIAQIDEAENGARLNFSSQPLREGTIRVRNITENPPRAELICRAYTEECKQLASVLISEIVNKQYGPVVSSLKAGEMYPAKNEPSITGKKPEYDGQNENIIAHRDELVLACDKREFRAWLEHQYPAHAKYYKDTPKGATFLINLTEIQINYSFEAGQHKYVFEITEPKGYSKIREDFIATVRNTFAMYPTLFDAGQPINTLADNVGGTAIYGRDTNGRIIPYSVNPNSGFVFEIGQNSIAIKPERAEIQYPVEFNQSVVQTYVRQEIEPPKPPEPKVRGGKIDLWLDWYHAMNDNGHKCTLKTIASKSGYSLGYIKQKHMVYQAKSNQNT